eukprot:COSAG01_NODE_17309_length_1161_cov_2.859699_1_plen_203_part_00
MGEKCFAGTCVYCYDVVRTADIERLRELVQRFTLTEARRKVQYEELDAAVLGSVHCYSSEAEAAPSTLSHVTQSPEHVNHGKKSRQQLKVGQPTVLQFALASITAVDDNPPVRKSGFVVRGGVKMRCTTTVQMPEDALNTLNKLSPSVKIRRTINGGQRLGARERDFLPSVGAEKLSRAKQELADVAGELTAELNLQYEWIR